MKLRLVSVVLFAACGSHGGSSLQPPEYNVATCTPIKLEPGPFGNCGPNCTGNSPVVNAFPINGIAKHGDGACNPEGVQILPHSLRGGGCGWGRNLGLDKSGKLAGMSDDGAVVCEGQELAGAEFIARHGLSTTLTLTIANVRMLKTTPPQKPREGYRIESGGQTMCDPDAANRARQELGLLSQATYAVPNAPAEEDDGNGDLVIPIVGPLYSNTVKAINDGSKLFNLACANDALAKRSINEVITEADSDERKLAALRMLTGDYCGMPRTMRGMKVDWGHHETGNLEAHWRNQETTCLDAPRLTYLPDKLVKSLPPELTPKTCPTGGCTTWPEWATNLRAECGSNGIPFCTPPDPNHPTPNTGSNPASANANGSDDPNYDFESYIHEDDKTMSYEKKMKN